MSTVLLLSKANIDAHPVSIRECHINVWILPAFLGKCYLFDVGLFLKNGGTAPLEQVQLIVPIGTPDTPRCLVAHMDDKQQNAWCTIFGRKSPDAQTRTRTELRRVEINGLKSHSCWDVMLTRAIAPDAEGYLRVRFSSYDRLECIDTFGGWFGLGARLRLDLRLFDHHELADFRGLPLEIDSRLIPIKHSYVYLVAPHVNHPELYSPPFAYIRILEDPLWRGYLGRKPSLLRRRTRKMHVFAWKRQSEDGAAPAAHRIFATLIPRGLPSTIGRAVSVGSGAVALLAAAVASVYPTIYPTMGTAISPLFGLPWWNVSGVFAAILLILSLPRLVGWVAAWLGWFQSARGWIDAKLYAIRD